MTTAQLRQEMTGELLSRTCDILDSGSMNRDRLAQVKTALENLSDNAALWQGDEFPAPSAEEKQNRFLIDQDAERGLSLYLNVMQPGKKIPPHNHTTWACIAAVEGAEINTLYDRTDDGSVAGQAELHVRKVIELKPGNSLAMMPDDIHSVEIRGNDVIRHLHFYGKPLETLDERISYDLEAGTCKIMDIGVKTKR